MASIAAVSSTNEGISTAHPNYSVNVAIPSPASGAADDIIIVLLGYRAPRSTDGFGVTGGPVLSLLGASSAGLTGGGFVGNASDTITINHGNGNAVLGAVRSAFVGGSLTVTATATTATAGELHVSLTTIVVDGAPGAPVSQITTGSAYTGSSVIGKYDNVSVPGDFNVAMMTDTIAFTGAVTLSTAGSFSMNTSRVLSGTSSVPHRIGIATATDPTAGGYFSSGLNDIITTLGFAGAAPPATGGIFVDGAIHI